MPSFSTHYIFARSVEDRVRDKDSSLSLSKSAFYHGTQGPDFLFTHRVWRLAWGGKTLKDLGSELHHCNPSKMFALMKEYLENEPCDRDIVKSYIYGFLCHYALDRNAHPLIYAVQEELTKAHGLENHLSLTVHNQIEYNIDTMMLKGELGYSNGLVFNNAATLDNNPYLIDEMAGLIAYVVQKMDLGDATKEDIATAYNDMIFSMKMLHDPTGIKRKILGILQTPIKKKIGPLFVGMVRQKNCDNKWDYMNITHKEWAMPYDKRRKSTESFMDLYHKAQLDALELIDAFNSDDAQKAIEELTGNMSFDTGLSYDIKEPIA